MADVAFITSGVLFIVAVSGNHNCLNNVSVFIISFSLGYCWASLKRGPVNFEDICGARPAVVLWVSVHAVRLVVHCVPVELTQDLFAATFQWIEMQIPPRSPQYWYRNDWTLKCWSIRLGYFVIRGGNWIYVHMQHVLWLSIIIIKSNNCM